MGSQEEFQEIYIDSSLIINAINKDKNLDILLYLAKYNPKITIEDIIANFGEKSLKGLEMLISCNLVNKFDNKLTLSNEGIFHLDNLISLMIY
jgi:hypothetical protein